MLPRMNDTLGSFGFAQHSACLYKPEEIVARTSEKRRLNHGQGTWDMVAGPRQKLNQKQPEVYRYCTTQSFFNNSTRLSVRRPRSSGSRAVECPLLTWMVVLTRKAPALHATAANPSLKPPPSPSVSCGFLMAWTSCL